MNRDLSDLRKNYELAALDEASAMVDPFDQFERWMTAAIDAKIPEPNAMTLATVGSDLRPSTRIVLIKHVDDRGLVWFTNFHSRKGQELAGNPYAALQFHWVELERTVRIEGVVERVDEAFSDHYFQSRPLQSRLAALASPQSQTIADRPVLLSRLETVRQQHGDKPTRPAHWGGYRLVPDRWEFWQGRRDRLHDRLSYRLVGTPLEAPRWQRSRLAP